MATAKPTENIIKHMDIKEFREKGYLQELNRRFLHPLGLGLEITINSDGSETIGGVWDYKDDPEGLIFDISNSDEERKNRFKKNQEFIDNEYNERCEYRRERFGFDIEPIN
jgi:hypothetical protein